LSLITVNELTKVYSVRSKKNAGNEKGLLKVLKDLTEINRYRQSITAVNNISFDIGAGETVGFLGPNGAGKSTTVKMLTGVLVPTSGDIKVNGLSPYGNRLDHAMNIGVVFGQKTTLWWDLPLRDSFELLKVIYEISHSDYRKSLAWLIDILDLGPLLDRPVRQLSLGQRMRAELAAALLHRPAVLFLDEPTIGLDIAVKQRIRLALRELNREWGVTILLTTHDLRDIEEICQKVIVINKGQLMYDGSLTSFRNQFCRKRVIRVALKDLYEVDKLLKELPPEVTYAEHEGPWVTLYFEQTKTTAASVANWIMSKYPVEDLVVEEPSIENTVAELYRGEAKS
jgi:ABC-2 type transport system ATP-binding protein